MSSSETGDSHAKLLRQIETLQTQYAVASENWQGLESALKNELTDLKQHRDDLTKREAETRRKARDINTKARKMEDEMESLKDRVGVLEHELTEREKSLKKLQTQLAEAEKEAKDARTDLEHEKKVLEADYQQKLDEERAKWQQQLANPESTYLRAASPTASRRKEFGDAPVYSRRGSAMPRSISTADLPLSPLDRMLQDDRRPASGRSRNFRGSEVPTPIRQDSTPSFYTNGVNSRAPSISYDADEMFGHESPPMRNIPDMISVSIAGGGPSESVQLVERMSAQVRRLESERAAHKEEMERLAKQLEEARESVVSLMREVDEKTAQAEKTAKLEKELADMEHKHEFTLELLGEEKERVEDLEEEIREMKGLYRDLLEQKMPAQGS